GRAALAGSGIDQDKFRSLTRRAAVPEAVARVEPVRRDLNRADQCPHIPGQKLLGARVVRPAYCSLVAPNDALVASHPCPPPLAFTRALPTAESSISQLEECPTLSKLCQKKTKAKMVTSPWDMSLQIRSSPKGP